MSARKIRLQLSSFLGAGLGMERLPVIYPVVTSAADQQSKGVRIPAKIFQQTLIPKI